MFSYDFDKDSRLNAGELSAYLTDAGYTPTQIKNAESKFLSGGYMDLAQWMKTLESFDTNKNGVWESADDEVLRTSVL
jgi:hypothetical protein